MDQKGWVIKVEGVGARDAMTQFNAAMAEKKLGLAVQRRLQRAAIELLVGAGENLVGIVCSGNNSEGPHGYTALSLSVTAVTP